MNFQKGDLVKLNDEKHVCHGWIFEIEDVRKLEFYGHHTVFIYDIKSALGSTTVVVNADQIVKVDA